MSKSCYVTGKKNLFGNNRPFSKTASRRKWKANLQKVRILDENGEKKTVYVSARALKKHKLNRAQ
ncbi:MAG: 50S ribosomal protein L28 [Bacillota bacterium]